MPAHQKPSPSSSNDTGPQPEQKQRKRPGRVPVSCAECRRLKLRCDRKVPCETCVKRGCSAICPEGALTTGKGNRLALADVDELHKKIERLRSRCSHLEEALRTVQSVVTDQPHPLLAEENEGGDGDEKKANQMPYNLTAESAARLSREDEEFLDAFGTLTLGLRGESRFYGQTARAEYLIHANENPPLVYDLKFPNIDQTIVNQATMPLEMPLTDMNIKKLVISRLPTLSQACRLCDIFLECGEYLWCPPPRSQLFDEILGVIYRSNPMADEENSLLSTHSVALLFLIFALAKLFEPDSESYTIEALEFYILGRLALRFAPPDKETTLWGIQAMIYMSMFSEYCDKKPGHSSSHKLWQQVGFAVKLGLGIGLHVSSSRWQLDAEASQRRSTVFWQLFTTDTWLSFGFGRPPCMSLAFIDCELPKDPEERVNSEGQREWGYHHWTWQYAKLLHNIMSTAFGCKTPIYSTVLDLDRKVRDFPIPWRLRLKCDKEAPALTTTPLRMQRWFIMASKESTLLNLHRPYFAQALNEQPDDLLRHRYGPSVMAIYRSAWRLIEGLKETWKHEPFILGRISLPWSQALSGAIVMCLLVTRAPGSCLSQASLFELDRICELFQEAAPRCKIANNNLSVVVKLTKQAHDATGKAGKLSEKSSPALTELDRLGGKTHLLTSRAYDPVFSSPNPDSLRPSLSRSSSVPTSITLDSVPNGNGNVNGVNGNVNGHMNGYASMEAVHPSIMQDIRMLEATNDVQSLIRDYDFTQMFNVPTTLAGPPTIPTQPSPPITQQSQQQQQQPLLQQLVQALPPDPTGQLYIPGTSAPTPNPATFNTLPPQDPSQLHHIPAALFSTEVLNTLPEMYLREDLFAPPTPSSFSTTSSTTTHETGRGPAPVLDATWQSFVEQLGF